MGDAMLFLLAALAMIPLVMAGVTLLVSDRVNRYVNLIAGLLIGALGVWELVAHATAGEFHWHGLLVVLAGALAFLIAGLSELGLRQSLSPASARESEPSPPREGSTV